MPAGSIVGSLAVTSLTDRIGRKNTIILASAIWVLGGVTQCAAIVRSFPMLSNSPSLAFY
jgi:MFS family permease